MKLRRRKERRLAWTQHKECIKEFVHLISKEICEKEKGVKSDLHRNLKRDSGDRCQHCAKSESKSMDCRVSRA